MRYSEDDATLRRKMGFRGLMLENTLIAKHIPQSSLVLLPGAGHLPFLERPADYHRQVSTCLAQS